MTEHEKILHAKYFIDKLANGINPIDGSTVPDNDTVNNVRISRCLFYVSSLLQEEVNRLLKGIPSEAKPRKAPFSITQEQLKSYVYSSKPISASTFAKKLNWLVRDEIEGKRMERLSYRKITEWLLDIGMIEYRETENGRKKRFPTSDGEEIGLILVWYDRYGKHTPVVFYTESAQRFIIDNIDGLIASASIREKHTHDSTDTDEEIADEDA